MQGYDISNPSLDIYFKCLILSMKYISSLSKNYKILLVGVLQLEITGFPRKLNFVFYVWLAVQAFKNNITRFSKIL